MKSRPGGVDLLAAMAEGEKAERELQLLMDELGIGKRTKFLIGAELKRNKYAGIGGGGPVETLVGKANQRIAEMIAKLKEGWKPEDFLSDPVLVELLAAERIDIDLEIYAARPKGSDSYTSVGARYKPQEGHYEGNTYVVDREDPEKVLIGFSNPNKSGDVTAIWFQPEIQKIQVSPDYDYPQRMTESEDTK